eukprot:403376197
MRKMFKFIEIGIIEFIIQLAKLLVEEEFKATFPGITSQLFELQVILLKLYIKVLKFGIYAPDELKPLQEQQSNIFEEFYWPDQSRGFNYAFKVINYEQKLFQLDRAIFRKALKVGSIIHIKQNHKEPPRKAQIGEWINSEPLEEDSEFSKYLNKIFLVKYFKENSQELLDEEFEILGTWSEKIQEKYYFDYKLDSWGNNLKLGMKVLVYDDNHWYPSIIVDEQIDHEGEFNQYTKIRIGYRLYHPQGTKSDEQGAFYGWSQRYDEWLAVKYDPNRFLPMLVFEASQGELEFVKYIMEEFENTLDHVQLDVPNKHCINELNDLYKLTGTPLLCCL